MVSGSFKKSLKKCVTISDRIGYIYWFFVLVTISFGGATGVFMTYRNRTAMDRVCGEKLDYYTSHYTDKIAALQSPFRPALQDAVQTEENGRRDGIHVHVAIIEDQLR